MKHENRDKTDLAEPPNALKIAITKSNDTEMYIVVNRKNKQNK